MSKEQITVLIESLEFWGIFGGILVSIGVVVESGIGIKIFRLNQELKSAERAEEQNRALEIAEFEKRTAELRLQLETTKSIASNANLKAESLSPLRQPIETITGFFSIKTGPTGEQLGMTESRKGLAEVMFRFGQYRPDNKSPAFDIVSKGKPTVFGDMTNGWDIYFECGQHPVFPGVFGPIPALPLGDVLKNLKQFTFDPYILPNRTQITGGQISLTFNSVVTINIPIPAHNWPEESLGRAFEITNGVPLKFENPK